MRKFRIVASLLVASLLLGAVYTVGRWAACQRKVDGEAIGGFAAETFAQYEAAVDDQSGGCTQVILVGTDGEVVHDPNPLTRIEPMTGEMLSRPITVYERDTSG